METNTTDHQGDLEAAIIAAYDAYMKARYGREMTDKEISTVLRTVSPTLFDLEGA